MGPESTAQARPRLWPMPATWRPSLAAQGITAGAHRVARLCSMQLIWSVFAKKRGLTRRSGPPVHDDLVRREFTAAAPDRLCLTDITEHPTGEGKLYLCAIKDAYSGRIVGYSIDSAPNREERCGVSVRKEVR